ncbi:MAG: hypothetical protein HYZ72_04660 [Deltaproteobacteria bacterium]|nr:hypothetical protein [Deltaproteobacteria bacterium]
MDTLIWINTLFLIFVSIVQGIILYAILREVRKSSEALSRVERLSLATLERVATRQGSQA